MTKSEQSPSRSANLQKPSSDPFWLAAEWGAALTELGLNECLELLAAKSVGRIAYTSDTGARIMPVNYVLAGDRIIFRTVPDGEIYRHALSTNCAFEIDDADELLESGWSVVVVGRLELATDEDFAYLKYGKLPEPWAGGNRFMFVRMPCTQVSGRRVLGRGR